MRRLFVAADLEGCGAVSSEHALFSANWEWQAARRWMTEDVVAICQVAFERGYEEVIVADSHGNAHNIDPDLLPDNVRLVRSWPRPLLMMQGAETPGVEACVFIGHHAAAGRGDSLLSHTFSSAFHAVRLNGEECSEGYLGAALAGELGAPVVLVSGDEHTAEDARRYAPEAVHFVSKHSVGWRSQMSLPPNQVRRDLKEALADALARPPPRPFLVRGPYRLEIELTNQLVAEMLSYLPGVSRGNSWSVSSTFDALDKVMRFISFAVFYSPSGAIKY